MATIDRTNATMEAAVFHGNDRISIERVGIPDVGQGEVLVRVSRTALCGSDFKLWHKGAEFTAGHEVFGVVEQPGHRMHGGRYAVYIPLHCDRCAACHRGDTQMCLEVSSLIGWNRPGGYAEYLPVPENCLLPVPDDIEDSLAPLLLDTIGTSAHAVRFVSRVVPPQEAESVLVTGAGPVGLGVILALRDAGYGDIHVSDPNIERLKIARTFGAKEHPVADTGKHGQSPRRRLDQHAAPVAFIRDTLRKAEAFKRVERTAYGRLSELQRFGETTDRMRPRLERNPQENGRLSHIEIRTISSHSFSENILQKDKGGRAIHDSSKQARAPREDSPVFRVPATRKSTDHTYRFFNIRQTARRPFAAAPAGRP